MCDPVTASVALAAAAGVVTAGGQIYSGMATNAQMKYERNVAERNAEMERREQRDAIEAGETNQRNHYRRLAQTLAEARVKNSSSGLDVTFGSAAGLEDDIAMIGAEDSATIAQNTYRETMGYDVRASNYVSEGRAARARGKAAMTGAYIGAAGTLLGTASQTTNSMKQR